MSVGLKVFALLLFIISIVIVGLVLFSRFSKNPITPGVISNKPSPSPTSSTLPQQGFKVVSTDPKNGETNVYPGEIKISFSTDVPVVSEKAFSVDINPKLPFYSKITNSFPNNQIVIQVYGGLAKNTIYTVSVKDSSDQPLAKWSFTTSSQPNESSSQYVVEFEKSYNQKYLPLIDFVPYYSNDFNLGYEGDLRLRVIVKNPNIDLVKHEVNDWIRSHGVDPSTHTINYINNF